MTRFAFRALALVAAAALCARSRRPRGARVTVNIGPGTRAIYLQVGNGSFTGTYSGGGTPGNNATINQVTVTVPAAQVGSGTAQQMTSNSTQAASYYDNFTFCNPPVQVYIGGFFRLPGAAGTATLSVTTSAANLVNATGDTIPVQPDQLDQRAATATRASRRFPAGRSPAARRRSRPSR